MQKLFYGGDIITMEGEGQYAEAVLIEDGLIKAAGTQAEAEALKGADCQMVDLKGKTLMPSFIDGHGHISMTAYYATRVDLTDATCFDDIIQIIKDFRVKNDLTHGEYILGYGYDHNFLKEKDHPTKAVLDQVSTENPIYIAHASGHMGAANSLALEKAGINADTPDPDNGVIARIAGTREPNGYVEEGGMSLLMMSQQSVPLDMMTLGEAAQDVYLANGITTVQDGASGEDLVKVFKGLDMMGKLKLDIVAYPIVNNYGQEVLEANQDCLCKYLHHFKIGGYKIVLDGSPQGKSAWLTKPYEGDKDYCGYAWLKEEEVEQCMKQAVDDNQQILAHCNGDAASDQFIRCYQKALRESKNPNKDRLRPVMIHCQTVRDDQLDEMAKLHMLPSIFVSHTYYWGDVHLKNLGQERGNHVSPAKAALDRGLIYNFHTDTPVVKPLMLHTIWAAVNRITRYGAEIGPDQKIGVYDALKGITINAAYAYFEEDSKGSIKAGKRADLVLLDKNPLKVDTMAIKEIKVLETIKDGVTVYQA